MAKYSKEMREQTAAYIIESKRSITQVAKEIGVNVNTLCRWVNDYRKRHNMPTYAVENGIKERMPKDEEELRARTKQLESDKTYGYRAIKKSLEQKGTEISEYKIRKIMRENGLYPETRKKYKPYRKGKADGKYYRTKLGWVYLAAVIDLYNREIIGYAVSKKIDTELVEQALGNAIGRSKVAEGLVFHSDRGSQYASRGYQKMLAEHGIKGSMSKPGCPYDNASMESFLRH